MEALIKVENITKDYELDSVISHILNGLSFEISRGEHVAIMGPSGSGKSTLMHILGLLDRPSSGHYFFRGKDTSEFSDDEQAQVRNREFGFVFQIFNLLARTTVLDNVRLPLAYFQDKSQDELIRAKKVIEAVGLSHRMNNRPSQLSGGEQQRVAIARALINNPSVIFADEPTGNLDSKSGEQIMKLLKDLHHQGHTIVVVSHDINIANQAERMISLKDGLVVKDEKI